MEDGDPDECAVCGALQAAPTVGGTPCKKHTWNTYPGGARECKVCGKQEACPEDDENEEEWDEWNKEEW